jgi:hypothetical protein
MKDGLLSLETHDAPLIEVISRIGELADFKTVLADDFIEPSLLNVSFHNVTVQNAVQRLVSDENRIIIYRSKSDDEVEPRIISQVWLLGLSNASVHNDASDNETFGSAEESVVKSHKLAALTDMLQQSQETPVRARAAIALGALRDARAVIALESALLDPHLSVRFQAINALGRIGGERATTVLGNFLLHGTTDNAERVLAAQALWKQDTEAAKNYLQAGAYDTDAQVQTASSKPPSSSTNVRATNSQIGGTASQ